MSKHFNSINNPLTYENVTKPNYTRLQVIQGNLHYRIWHKSIVVQGVQSKSEPGGQHLSIHAFNYPVNSKCPSLLAPTQSMLQIT